jgi:prepilin-type N-terminal cleavage/methylation domain-containing protein
MRTDGFSLVELLVVLAITCGVTAAMFGLVHPSSSLFAAQTESADMHQRLRVAADALMRDANVAGAGSLTRVLAPVLPYRADADPDEPSTFRTDAITLTFVPLISAQAVTTSAMSGRSAAVNIRPGHTCIPVGLLCGLVPRMRVVTFDEDGHDMFTLSNVNGATANFEADALGSTRVYSIGTPLVEIVRRSYFLRIDPGTGVEQLVRSDGPSEVPIADHIVGLTFEYHGDPRPPRIIASTTERPDTSYGPRPPPTGQQATSYPAGENCVFANTGGHVPRLQTLQAGIGTLFPLSAEQLTDGPWCPDAFHPDRFDADLLRIRRIGVTLRVQAALDGLRGPAGPLFVRAGTARAAGQFVPDLEATFHVAPPNLNVEE